MTALNCIIVFKTFHWLSPRLFHLSTRNQRLILGSPKRSFRFPSKQESSRSYEGVKSLPAFPTTKLDIHVSPEVYFRNEPDTTPLTPPCITHLFSTHPLDRDVRSIRLSLIEKGNSHWDQLAYLFIFNAHPRPNNTRYINSSALLGQSICKLDDFNDLL